MENNFLLSNSNIWNQPRNVYMFFCFNTRRTPYKDFVENDDEDNEDRCIKL